MQTISHTVWLVYVCSQSLAHTWHGTAIIESAKQCFYMHSPPTTPSPTPPSPTTLSHANRPIKQTAKYCVLAPNCFRCSHAHAKMCPLSQKITLVRLCATAARSHLYTDYLSLVCYDFNGGTKKKRVHNTINIAATAISITHTHKHTRADTDTACVLYAHTT